MYSFDKKILIYYACNLDLFTSIKEGYLLNQLFCFIYIILYEISW
jgi:hypothetical protein